ncbi:hypothetical protein [Alkalimarinus sediminis]|uniref:Uncharacterized protein n=1 Tax=Alkalimarinus sediminis TaxID=1632866 RepID=A0A9E8KPJ8_9ALTE|nr:hypothetical protein [Alkalimarinus sediminis]UZW74255.1 hypothetical protein NNL22_14680 [Alkalimarinus sediminis]
MESKGKLRLDTLELVAKDLNSNLILIPKEKLNAVQAVLESESSSDMSRRPEQLVPIKVKY